MSAPHVSIILPIYNVEAYLEKCLMSIANQRFTDFEALMIDDGSADGGPDICDRWAERDPRFFVVHQKNGGLCNARNVGLERARGAFLCFIDPDDYVEETFLSALVEAQARGDADLTVGRVMRLNEDGKVIAQTSESEERLITRDEFEKYLPELYRELRMYYVYPKLFRSERYGALRFDETMKISEDSVWNAEALCLTRSIQLSNDTGYRNIRYRTRGMTKQPNLKQFDCHARAYASVMTTAEKYGWASEALTEVMDERAIAWAGAALRAIRRGRWSLRQQIIHTDALCREPIFINAYDRQSHGHRRVRYLRCMRNGDGLGALMDITRVEIINALKKKWTLWTVKALRKATGKA